MGIDLPLIQSLSQEIATIIAPLIALVTLLYIARQTKHLGNQIQQNTTISISQYYQNVNIQLLQHPDEATSLLGENKEDAMASIIFGALHLSFDLQKGQKVDKPSQEADKATIIYALKQESMRRHWEQNKPQYDPEFVQFIDRIFQEHYRNMQMHSEVPQQQ